MSDWRPGSGVMEGMKTSTLALFAALLTIVTGYSGEKESVHDFTVESIDGKKIKLSDYKDKVLIIVNVASKCGYTRHYENMVALHDDMEKKGVVVMGFPANNFGGQEPGSNEEIEKFCSSKFGVEFPMFAKVSVKGKDQDALFKYLTSAENEDFTGDIKWNFEKFLVGKDGKVKRRFRSNMKPDSKDVVEAIEKELAAKPKG